jgi:hypothetical protein
MKSLEAFFVLATQGFSSVLICFFYLKFPLLNTFLVNVSEKENMQTNLRYKDRKIFDKRFDFLFIIAKLFKTQEKCVIFS